MSKYTQLLQNLLEIKTVENEYLITFYFCYDQKTSWNAELREHFRAAIQTELGLFEPLNDFKKGRAKLVELFYEVSANFDFQQEGFAIFARFTVDNSTKGNWDIMPPMEYWWTNLHTCKNTQIYVEKEFYVDQLVDNANTDSQTLILDVERSVCNIYTLGQKNLEKVADLTNNRPNVVVEQGNDTGWVPEEDEKFLDDINQKITELKLKFDYVAVLYSANFTPVLAAIKTKFTFPDLHTESLFIQKNIQTENESNWWQEIDNLVVELGVKNKQKELEMAKNDYQNYITDWEKILDSCNKSKIETLFIKPALTKSGMVVSPDILSIESNLPSAMPVNIVPLLLKKVLSLGGKIAVLSETEFENEESISCKLRF